MSEDSPQITTLSDISANMFAAFILILIMVAAEAANRSPPQSAPDRTITDRDLSFVKRRALDPKAMVGMLYDRRPVALGTSVDLHATGLTILRDGGSQSALAASLPSLLDGRLAPVRLYVFSNDQYDATSQALAKAGLAWREISVPRALRGSDGDDWRPAFKDLIRGSVEPAPFRAGLARLLEGGPGRASAAAAAERFSAPAEEAAALDLIARFDRALRAALNVLALVVACGVIFFIERRTRSAHVGEIRRL